MKGLFLLPETNQIDYCERNNNILQNLWQLKVDSLNFFEKNFYNRTCIIEVQKITNDDYFNVTLSTTQFDITEFKSISITANITPTNGRRLDGKIAYKLLLKRNGNTILESPIFEMTINNLCHKCAEYDIITLKAKPVIYSDYSGNEFQCAELEINPIPLNIKIGTTITISLKAKYGVNEFACRLDNYVAGAGNLYSIQLNGERRIIPVFISKNGLPLPNPDDYIKVEAICRFQTCCEQIIKKEVSTKYGFDPRYNRLRVEITETDIRGEEITTLLNNGNTYNLKEIYLLDSGCVTKTIVVRNTATQATDGHINRGIKIDSIKTCFTGEEERIEGVPSQEWNNSIKDLNLVVDNNSIDNNSIEIPIKIDFDAIKNVTVKNNCGYMLWSLKIDLEYEETHYKEVLDQMENKVIVIDEQNTLKNEFSCNIEFKLYRKNPVFWYSLDFGTSAIALYKSRQNHNGVFEITPIALDRIKKELLLNNFTGKGESFKIQDRHLPAPLIASNIYMNHSYSKNDVVKKFKDERLWLSPSASMVTPSAQLPCLKNMIGHRYIPQIIDNEFGNIEVDSVFEEVYKQLCKYYLTYSDDNKIESLLLTVPNTFTPVQIEKIRNIVLTSIPTLREDKLNFISESDAVLCSYVKNTINNAESKKIRLYNKAGTTGEYVLVFDMGAGTLDISYALVSRNADDKYKLDVIDRIGVNKAGNYIDYLLGEIICDLVLYLKNNKEEDSTYKRLKGLISFDTNIVDYALNNQFKDYLRNKVKPLLNSEASTTLPAPDTNNSNPVWKLGGINVDVFKLISIGDILEHDKFKNYLKSCAYDVIDGIKQRNTCNKNKLKIDTVIISGRGTSLNAIREAIVSVVNNNELVSYAARRRCYDFITGKYCQLDEALINNNETDTQGAITPLKTVVARGALDYMIFSLYNSSSFTINKREHYGSYGVILIRPTHNEWVKFIDTKNNQLVYNNTLSTVGVTAIYLCHSYSTNPADDYDMTTVLDRRTSLPPIDKMAFFLSINGNIVNYKVGNTQITIDYHNDYCNENLRKSLWPVVYQI